MIIDVMSTKSFIINLGRQGENDITEIVFDYSGLAENIPIEAWTIDSASALLAVSQVTT